MSTDLAAQTAATTATAASETPLTIPVAIVGFGWMGRVHAQAYARIRHHFPTLHPVPQLTVIADELADRAGEAARQFGVDAVVTDWRDVVSDLSLIHI